jgi:hypothetical protein
MGRRGPHDRRGALLTHHNAETNQANCDDRIQTDTPKVAATLHRPPLFFLKAARQPTPETARQLYSLGVISEDQ